ncbi:MAG: DNA gyrase inhibitor YacG [Geminicoccaceae bacterium]|nr:DNA gyrase inhibitor YacG [Geminicoccaceae bacterium]MCX8099922.1 DNA gyrase inhibitor YacG [Geminicoccaceae bacterium]MDW8370056.1 DNA gyrase inhibitor YacG [Geminicoccaceae bacterium]
MADRSEPSQRAVRGRRCPVCGRPSEPRYRPFCSALCRDRDLLDWFDERHRVPVVEREADEETGAELLPAPQAGDRDGRR